jgi:hypothetical protein
MKYVLYAVDKLRPSHNFFQHTVDLCAEITSCLCVLQLIHPHKFRYLLSAAKSKLEMAHQIFETSMSAATYAQAGSSELARQCLLEGGKRLNELRNVAQRKGVHVEAVQRIGHPAQEVLDFLNERPQVILAVLDVDDTLAEEERGAGSMKMLSTIPYRIGIPILLPLHYKA